MKKFFRHHITSVAATLVVIFGFVWSEVKASVINNDAPKTAERECQQCRNVDANDKVVGLVLGVGSILVLIGCWRLERQNDVKDATIYKLQKEIEGLKNHAWQALDYNLAKGHRRCFTAHRVRDLVVKISHFFDVFSLKKPCFCINIQNNKKKGIRGVWVSKR